MKKEIIIGALLLILGFVIGIICKPSRIERVVDIQRDTITKIDTHVVEKPVLVEKRVTDTMFYAVHDTTRVKDTLYVALPREEKIYKGEDYYAEVSGYEPTLDYLEVYPKTKIVTEKVTSYRACNFLSIGVETNYMTSLSTPIYLEYSYLLHRNVEMYARFLYDLPGHQIGVGLGTKVSIGW